MGLVSSSTEIAAATPRAARRPVPARLVPLVFCLAFFLQGLIFVPYIGLQADEMLFGNAIYPPLGAQHSVRILNYSVPTMLMSYVGALKAWIYFAIFRFWPPSPWSVRVPVLVAGAATVWLFFVLIRSAVGPRTAVFASALLVTDASFILTDCLDWGPIALQHLLLASGLLLLLRFHRTSAPLYLGAGFFVFGLALWDKAVFSWLLAGLLVAAAAVFPRELFAKLTLRSITVAAAAFLIGAAPVVEYNVSRPLNTFRSNAKFSNSGLPHKAAMLHNALAGSSLLGYVVQTEPAPQPGAGRNLFERASLRLSRVVGLRLGLMPVASLLAFLLLPWVWRTPARKPMLFSLIFVAVAWLPMAFLENAGASQHAVLLWPFPHLFVAAALAHLAPERRAVRLLAVCAVAAVCLWNEFVLNQHLAWLIDRGTTTVWTDAIEPLSRYLGATPAAHMYILDWGIREPLRALNQGQLALEFRRDLLTDFRPQAASQVLAARDAIFVDHAAGKTIVAGARDRLDALAVSEGYRKQTLKIVADRHGRPVFEVFRFAGNAGFKPRAG